MGVKLTVIAGLFQTLIVLAEVVGAGVLALISNH